MARKTWIILGAILLLFLCLPLVISSVLGGSSTVAPSVPATRVASPTEVPVTTQGIIVPARYARLSFEASGTITHLLVREGDHVKAGDLLAQLDQRDAELQVEAAEDSLNVELATLARSKAPSRPEEISAAQANLRNALAQLERATHGPSSDELAIQQASVSKAAAAVQSAQAAYDRVGGASNPMIGMLPQSLALQQALQDYETAKGNYNLKVKVDPVAVASAEAAVYNAQLTLKDKSSGPRAVDLAVQEARVQQARTALAQARATLTKTVLLSLLEGTITSIAARQGEIVASGTPVMTVADLSLLQVETTDCDEWGAARIKPGQRVQLKINAYANKVLTGRVIRIASQSVTLSTGDVSYVVTIALDQQDPDVRWGMTAKVEFQRDSAGYDLPVAR